jgi:steroid delta-isomerase-like uncharacterized protein
VTDELARIDDLASTWLQAWTGDADFEASCAHDVQYEDPLAKEPLRGVDAVAQHAARLREAVPDLRMERTGQMLTGGAFVCIPWRAAGTHKNGSVALPATNRFITLHGLHYLELADDQVRRARGFYDLYDAATQMGILPARGGLGESVLLVLRGFGLRAG